MLPRLARLTVIASLLSTAGLPVAIAQATAWTRMAIGFAQHDGVIVSLRKTFDGRHACDICSKLRESHASFSAPARPQARTNLISPSGTSLFVLVAPIRAPLEETTLPPWISLSLDPPPPRSSLS